MSEKAKNQEKHSPKPDDNEQQEAPDLEDEQLDEASGGIGLLLPAIQKVRDTSLTDTSLSAEQDLKQTTLTDSTRTKYNK